MNPLTNSALGVLFLGVGAIATVMMYYLRGHSKAAAGKPARAETERPGRADAGKHSRATLSGPARRRQPGPSSAGTVPVTIPRRDTHAGRQPTAGAVKTETKWYKVAGPNEVATGSVKEVKAGTRTVALAHLDGQYGAIDGQCPHQGGPLAEGTLEDGLLRCPWHGWGFDPKTGKSAEAHHGDVEFLRPLF